MTHVAGASSEERRTRLFGTCKFQPIKGPAETWEAERLDVTRASLEAFARAAQRRSCLSDTDRRNDPRRRRNRSNRAFRILPEISRKNMNLGRLGHLSYSTLVHPGDNWELMSHSLRTYVPKVKARVSPNQPFGLSLRLAAPSAEVLVKDKTAREGAEALHGRATICISTR